jgi:hypothetical protein
MALQTTPLSADVTIVLGATGTPVDPRTVHASADRTQPATREIDLISGTGFFLTEAWYTPIDGLDGMPSVTRLEAQVVANSNRARVKVLAAGKPGASGSITIRITALNQTTV